MTHNFIGQMVLYRLTEDDALKTNKRRADAQMNIEKMREERPGFQAHVGGPVNGGVNVPMIVTDFSGHFVNGQVFLDGNDSLWVTEVEEGIQPGQWQLITEL